MVGTSWSGFNGLQLAARTPPALAAVISIYASDDRYADDVHYRGGLVIPMDMAQWANCMLSWNALPPDPAIAGSRSGERSGATGSSARRTSSSGGWRISVATTTGGTARPASTMRPSAAPSWRSAAGPTATPTPSCACSSTSTCRAAA